MKKFGLFTFVALLSVSCARNAPPNLTPQATTAWYGTQVIKSLDLVRDIIIDANDQTPPLVSTKTTRAFVTYHKDAITIVHNASAGWQTQVTKDLDVVIAGLPVNEAAVITPYIQLLKTILKAVQ